MATTMDAILKIAAKGEGFKSVENQIKAVETAAEGVNKGLGGVNNIIGSITGGVVALGAGLTAAGLIAFAKSAIDAADSMRDLSQKTGVSVENLSKFQQVANQSGTDIDVVGNAMVKLSKNMKEAATTGSGPAAEALRTLGVSALDSTGKLKGVDQVMFEVADKFKAMPDGADKASMAVALFGKAGANMIPMLNEGRQAIEGLSASMSTDFAKKADAYNDSLERVKTKFGELGMAVASQLLPYLTQAVDFFAKVGSGLLAFFDNNKSAIQQAVDFTLSIAKGIVPWIVGITAVTTAYKALGLVMQGIAVVGALVEAVTTKGVAMRLAMAGAVAALAAPAVASALVQFKKGMDAAGDGANKLQRSIADAADEIDTANVAQKSYQASVDASNASFQLLLQTIESTSQAIQRQAKLKEATVTADIAVNNAAKSILQSELNQATTKEQKIRLTLQIMELEISNARLQQEAAKAQIDSEIKIAGLKVNTAITQRRMVEAELALAQARGQDVTKIQQALSLQKIAADQAQAELNLTKQIAVEKQRASQAQYEATVTQIRSTTQQQLSSLQSQNQAFNNIVSSSGRIASNTASIAASVGNAADSSYRFASGMAGAMAVTYAPGADLGAVFSARSGRGISLFASGGYVSRATRAIVGEAGPEYIIPAGRMEAAASNYLAGARGAAVLSGGSSGTPQINITTGPVLEFDGQQYVTVDDLQRATKQVAESVLGRLRTPSARLALGLR